MIHFPITNTFEKDNFIEFSHYDCDASAGTWRKENKIILDSVKINVFVGGVYSVFSDGVLHRPTYGDISVFPPMKMHYGQITEATHTNYYQLDIGRSTFSAIPDGDSLIERLIEQTTHSNSFVRPSANNRDGVLKLCNEIEEAIKREELALAFAKTVEFVAFLCPLYLSSAEVKSEHFSVRNTQIIRYVEKHFSENITLEKLSEELGVSASFLSRIFKKEVGISIHEYINQYRILKSLSFLKTNSVTETGYLCGFSDTSHFISVFKKHIKTTPMQYKLK